MQSLSTCAPVAKASASEFQRVLDHCNQSIRSLQLLNIEGQHYWDPIFVFFVREKLDNASRIDWEKQITNKSKIPSYAELQRFMEGRIQDLQTALPHSVAPTKGSPAKGQDSKPKGAKSFATASGKDKSAPAPCPLCSDHHFLHNCETFKRLQGHARTQKAREVRACLNCLRQGHYANKCPSKVGCRTCGRRHHSLLHDAAGPKPSETIQGSEATASAAQTAKMSTDTMGAVTMTATTSNVVLLTTARVIIQAPSGKRLEVRALLDSGADTSFLSEWVAQELALKRSAAQISITGLQECDAGTARTSVRLELCSKHDPTFQLPFMALVLPKLASQIPSRPVAVSKWHHITGLPLADPDLAAPARVDLILGSDIHALTLKGDVRHGPRGTPVAQSTRLGWVLSGRVFAPSAVSLHCNSSDDLRQQLQQFWEQEELPRKSLLTDAERKCEDFFAATVQRDDTGRYVVRQTFSKKPQDNLATNRGAALSLLLSCERRLQRDPVLSEKYRSFMEEYHRSGHMKPVAPGDSPAYDLPHHGIVKAYDSSSKLRVVFNASFGTSTGKSLNDCLFPGPRLQPDLWLILSRWRLFNVVFTTDIVKMFRQIRIADPDQRWQRVL